MNIGLKNKKVLLLGLGSLGGGLATAKWLLDQGAVLTVTDLKTEAELKPSVTKLANYAEESIRDADEWDEWKKRPRLAFRLGGHDEEDIRAADIVVVNPDIPLNSRYVALARSLGKRIENEATLFYGSWHRPTIAVTGTRGKTTTTTWAGHLLGPRSRPVVAGSSYVRPLLSVADEPQKYSHAATELSSFLLEHFDGRPDIAIITNLYRDHLNRHRTMKEYAKAKASIFISQTAAQHLILNHDNAWTPQFLAMKPRAQVWFTSAVGQDVPQGLVYQDGKGMLVKAGAWRAVLNLEKVHREQGIHNLENALAAALAAHLAGTSWQTIQKRIATLPQIQYRQETVHQDRKLTVINDTTATSPEGAIAAIRRWGGPNCVLICGGTDRELEFGAWADAVRETLNVNNMVFLDGSATRKMRTALGPWGRGIRSYASLADALDAALARARKYVQSVVVFSPGAKSFELFRNEFDRGQQFNNFVKIRLG